MQQQYIVTNDIKKILIDCYPEYKSDIQKGNIHFLFDENRRLDFPTTESKTKVNKFKAKLYELFSYESDGSISNQQKIELQKMLIELYVYELTKPSNAKLQAEHYPVFNYNPPIFDLQQTVIENRIKNKPLYNTLHKYYYKAYYHDNIFIYSLKDFENPKKYSSLFMKTHLSNKTTFDLLDLPKYPIPNSKDTHINSEFPNISYESEYFVGNYNGRDVLFYKQITTTKDMFDYNKKGNKFNITLAVCINGNPTKKVCLLRYDYNPSDPHINRAYYSKTDNKLTLNTTTSKDYIKDKNINLAEGRFSHIHKYDENVAFLFPKKSAENMAENMLAKFESKQDLVDWFDKFCHLEYSKEHLQEVTKESKKQDTHYGE